MIADEQRCRNLVFTWNNYPDDWQARLCEDMPPHSYLVGGMEVGESGTPHIQGYVEFRNSVAGRTMKNKFPTVWFEERRRTAKEASDYCKKSCPHTAEALLEHGELSQQGKRRDITAVRQELKEGNGMRAILNDDTLNNGQCVRFAQTYLTYCERPRSWQPLVFWFYGKPGTMKTARAIMYAKRIAGDNFHIQTDSAKWWDGIDGHEVIIIDDIRESFCTLVQLLATLDRYPQRLAVKGGFRQNRAKYIFITCPNPPTEVFTTDENLDQLLRRITHISEIISCTESIVEKGDALPPFTQAELLPEAEEEDSAPSLDRLSSS